MFNHSNDTFYSSGMDGKSSFSENVLKGMKKLEKMGSLLKDSNVKLKNKNKDMFQQETPREINLFDCYAELLKENELLKKENAALKEGKEICTHFKGSEYTVLYKDILREVFGLNSAPHTLYVGKDGIKWLRSTKNFNGLTENGVKRFTHIITNKNEERGFKLCKCCECGKTALCTPEFDFYDTDDHGDGLLCEICFQKYMWELNK